MWPSFARANYIIEPLYTASTASTSKSRKVRVDKGYPRHTKVLVSTPQRFDFEAPPENIEKENLKNLSEFAQIFTVKCVCYFT